MYAQESDNNRPPPKHKFYNGQKQLPLLVRVTKEDIESDPELKQKIEQLREREETRKYIQRKNAKQRKSNVDEIALSIVLAVYDLDSDGMKQLLSITKKKHEMRGSANRITEEHTSDNAKNKTKKRNKGINRVYGEYSIVLAPKGSLKHAKLGDPMTEQCVAKKQYLRNTSNNFRLDPRKQPPNKKRKITDVYHCRTNDTKDALFQSLHNSQLMFAYMIHMIHVCAFYSGKKRYKLSKAISGYWECHAPGCDSQFITRDILEIHMEYLHGPVIYIYIYVCMHCMFVIAQGIYGCKWCHKLYRSQKNVQNHILKKHHRNGDQYIDAILYNQFTRVAKMNMKDIHVKFTVDQNTKNMEFAKPMTPGKQIKRKKKTRKRVISKKKKKIVKMFDPDPKLALEENIPLLHLLSQMEYESQKKKAIENTVHLQPDNNMSGNTFLHMPSIIPPFVSSFTAVKQSSVPSIKSENIDVDDDQILIPIKRENSIERDPLLSPMSEDEQNIDHTFAVNLDFNNIPQFTFLNQSINNMNDRIVNITDIPFTSGGLKPNQLPSQPSIFDINSPTSSIFGYHCENEQLFDMRSVDSAYMPVINSPISDVRSRYEMQMEDDVYQTLFGNPISPIFNERMTYDTCYYCKTPKFENGRSMLLCCGDCLVARYCGKECQARDYANHIESCSTLRIRKQLQCDARESIRILNQ